MPHAAPSVTESPAENAVPRTPLAVLQRGFGKTHRKDGWWVFPLVTFLCFSAFIVYATWAAFQGGYYHFGPYLSPFYSPELFGDSPHPCFPPNPPSCPPSIPFP